MQGIRIKNDKVIWSTIPSIKVGADFHPALLEGYQIIGRYKYPIINQEMINILN